MRIMLLGAEEELRFVCSVIRDEGHLIEVVGWNGYSGPEVLEKKLLLKYDYIILAFQQEDLSGYLSRLITAILGNSDGIIEFYRYYHAAVPMMTVDRVMGNPSIEQYEGMILGLSHAEVGILTSRLSAPFCNLAVSSQDLYYNMKTLEYCIKQYDNKIRNLKYLVIDMYDYTYFNYDVSLSRTAVGYYSWGGFLADGHHFNENKNRSTDYDFDQLTEYLVEKHYEGVRENKMDLWIQLFPDAHAYSNYAEYQNPCHVEKRVDMVTEQKVREYQADTSIIRNIYQSTMNENAECFYRILDMAYDNFPDIKIYLLLLPRYYEAERKAEHAYQQWKRRFYETIEEAGRKRQFTFLDFKGHEISKNAQYYRDVSHFNYLGAVKFSELLNGCMHLEGK